MSKFSDAFDYLDSDTAVSASVTVDSKFFLLTLEQFGSKKKLEYINDI